MAGPPHASRAARLRFATLIGIALAASGGLPHIPAQATAALAAGTAAPGTALAPAPGRRALAAQYLAIAKAGNRRLDHDFNRLEGPDRRDLERSRADLRAIAATERQFDHRLSRIAFGPRLERVAHSLYDSNQRRAALTTRAAGSSSLPEVHEYERLLNAANGPVERAVRTIRRELGLPPPPSS